MSGIIHPIWQSHVDVLEAQVELMRAQILALRQALPAVATETPVIVPAECLGIEKCGLRDESHRMHGSGFGSSRQWVCKGCTKTFGL
jgi:hypothetical protein